LVALAGTLVFQTASDYYLPAVGSMVNRVVLPASMAYVCLFVALLGIGFELVRRFTSRVWVAAVIVAIVAVASGLHQLRLSSTHQEHWEASWTEQQTALPGFEAAVRGLPENSQVIGFGVANYEPEFIPIFAAPWDLKGALIYETELNPPQATPLTGTSVEPCKPLEVAPAGTETYLYDEPGEPLFFINAATGTAVRVKSAAVCRRVISEWGTPPFVLG
jgi:hypothetical protein